MTLKLVLIALEILLLFLFLVPLPVLCSGNIAGIAVSLLLLGVTWYHKSFFSFIAKLWSKAGGRAAIIIAALILAAGVIYAVFLSVKMYKAQENRPDKPNVIVVLGCKVKGRRPTRMLRRRLEAAYKALEEHPDVLCIVSGGQGSNEVISEAEAMKNYLVEKGIDHSRMIMEDRSASTYENIKFSLEKLNELGISHDMTIVTDGFHEYRAGLIARAQGVENVTSYPAYTEPRYLFTYWVREWLGLTHFYILGR